MSIVPMMIAAGAAHRRAQDTAVVDAFRIAGATAPARAQSLDRLGLADGDAVARLAVRGVLRGVVRNRYFLDESAVIAERAGAGGRRPPPGLILVLGLLLLVGLAALGALRA